MAERKASVERDTLETQIKASINLDGTGKARFDIGVPFLEHMLDQIARHGLIDLDIECKGDLHIDDHHTVEDVGITLGKAFSEAVGDKKGMTRYGHAYVPLDEALSRVVIDFSGRPGLQMHVPYTRATVGGFGEAVVIQNFALPHPAQGQTKRSIQRFRAGQYARKPLRPLAGKMLQQKGQLRGRSHKAMRFCLFQPLGKGFATLSTSLRASACICRWGRVDFRRWGQHLHTRRAQSLPQQVGHAVRPFRTGQQHCQPLPRSHKLAHAHGKKITRAGQIRISKGKPLGLPRGA